MKQEKELLRKQMKLLAEQSCGAMEDDLAVLSSAMCKTYRELERNGLALLITILFVVGLNSLACILVHIARGKCVADLFSKQPDGRG